MALRSQLAGPDLDLFRGELHPAPHAARHVHGVPLPHPGVDRSGHGSRPLADRRDPARLPPAGTALTRLVRRRWGHGHRRPLVKGRELGTGWTLGSLVARRAQAPGDGPELLMLGLILVGAAVIVAAINIATTVVLLRAPGLTIRRVPLFSFSMLVSASMLLLATPVLIVGLGLLMADHHYGGGVFDATRGGNPLVWARLFWFFAYPTLWALVLPGVRRAGRDRPGVHSHATRRNRAGHRGHAGAMVAIGRSRSSVGAASSRATRACRDGFSPPPAW